MEDKYEYKKPDKPIQTVDVRVPSGNVFLFERPSKFALMFNIQAMPAALTEKAIETWKEQGVGSEIEEAVEESLKNSTKEDRLRMFEMNMKIRDKVLELSQKPKLVLGVAKNKGERSVDDIDDTDLDYLFKWVASGGVAPALSTFPKRPEQSSLASASRRKVRSKTVASSGAK